MKARFNDFLNADFIPPQTWILREPLIFECPPIAGYKEIIKLDKKNIGTNRYNELKIKTPVDFPCNLASTPRALWWLVAPFDIARAAVIHDYLYNRIEFVCISNPNMSKKHKKNLRHAADSIFQLAMGASVPAIPVWKMKICYAAVRVFGGFNIKGY